MTNTPSVPILFKDGAEGVFVFRPIRFDKTIIVEARRSFVGSGTPRRRDTCRMPDKGATLFREKSYMSRF